MGAGAFQSLLGEPKRKENNLLQDAGDGTLSLSTNSAPRMPGIIGEGGTPRVTPGGGGETPEQKDIKERQERRRREFADSPEGKRAREYVEEKKKTELYELYEQRLDREEADEKRRSDAAAERARIEGERHLEPIRKSLRDEVEFLGKKYPAASKIGGRGLF